MTELKIVNENRRRFVRHVSQFGSELAPVQIQPFDNSQTRVAGTLCDFVCKSLAV